MKIKPIRWICLFLVLSLLSSITSCSPSSGKEENTTDQEKPITGVDDDGKKYTTVSLTDSGLALAPSFDVNGCIKEFVHTREQYESVAKALAEDGFNRVYAVVNHPGAPGCASAANQWNDPGETNKTVADSLIVSGSANFEFLYACHNEGLEVIAVYKPYEGGGVSKGEGADLSNSLFYEETVGGYWTSYSTFISENPEMRLSRKAEPDKDAIKNDVITKIDAAFFLDAYDYRNWTGSKITLNKILDSRVNTTPIKLYVSKNNLDYTEYTGDYEVEFTIEERLYLDENNWPLLNKKSRCLVATIDGIEIGPEYQYLALAMTDKTGRTIISQSMINIYNAQGEELPTTIGSYVRRSKGEWTTRPDDYLWGAESGVAGTDEKCLEYFESWGFEFDYNGTGVNADTSFINAYVYGIARGNFQYAKGALCEAYPEVREHWLNEIKYLLTMGYDGIEIRLQAHSFMISDYAYYGFNEPLMQAYIEKYGEDPRTFSSVSKETAYRIACLRGDYLLQFLTEAAEMTHAEGKLFGMQMRSGMIDTSMDKIMNRALHQCFCWAMPKVVLDWRAAVALCDTITIKENFSSDYDPDRIAELTAYAAARNIPVWITAYTLQHTYVDEDGIQIGQANTDFINQVAKDENVYGVQLYEWDWDGKKFQHAMQKLKEALNYIPREVE